MAKFSVWQRLQWAVKSHLLWFKVLLSLGCLIKTKFETLKWKLHGTSVSRAISKLVQFNSLTATPDTNCICWQDGQLVRKWPLIESSTRNIANISLIAPGTFVAIYVRGASQRANDTSENVAYIRAPSRTGHDGGYLIIHMRADGPSRCLSFWAVTRTLVPPAVPFRWRKPLHFWWGGINYVFSHWRRTKYAFVCGTDTDSAAHG